MTELFRFAAFISYSSRDAAFARRLHRALEAYHIPAQLGRFDLVGGGKKNRIFPVFRDREELPSGELDEAIAAALKASSALVIVCSPNAAASPWVNKEIETFLALGRRNRIFAIIAEDAPVTDDAGGDATALSFPPAFLGEARASGFEPIAADARKGKDGFRNAWLKVVAGLVGVNAGALQDRDRKRRRMQRAQIGAGVSAAALLGLVGAAALDALQWRTDLYQRAVRLVDQGLPAEAYPLGLGATAAPHTLLPMRDDEADALARGMGAAHLVMDLGPLRKFQLAPDSATLAIARNDASQTVAVLHLRTGGKIELGPLGALWNFDLAKNGATLLILRADDPNTGAVFDLRTGAVTDLGPLGFLSHFELAADGAALAIRRDNASATGAVFDLRTGTKTELGPLWAIDLAKSGTVLVFLRDHTQRVGAVLDLKTGAKTELGPLLAYELAENGSTLVIQRDDASRTGAVLDLNTGAETELGPLRGFKLGDNGVTLAIQRNDASQTGVVLDLKTGAKTELGPLGSLQRFGGFEFAAGGATLVIRRDDADRSGAFFDLQTGAKTELGPQRNFGFQADGATIVFLREDAGQTGAVLDLKTGAKAELGPLGPLTTYRLANDGATLVILRKDKRQTGAVLDLKSGAKTELGPLGPRHRYSAFDLSADGATLVIERGDARTTWAFFNLRTGAKTELGPLRASDLRGNGATMVVQRDDDRGTGAVFDLTRPVDVSGSGAALAASICAANAHAIRPFAPSLRDPARFAPGAEDPPEAADRRTHAILRGRPWNPCDWRGLAAIFPNLETGDAWFEGPRQWLRLMAVRLGHAPDYARAARAEMCRLYGPEAEGQE